MNSELMVYKLIDLDGYWDEKFFSSKEEVKEYLCQLFSDSGEITNPESNFLEDLISLANMELGVEINNVNN